MIILGDKLVNNIYPEIGQEEIDIIGDTNEEEFFPF